MRIKSPLLISIVAHIILILLSYTNIGGLFSPKMENKSYAVFDYVEIGRKSKAPIISDTEGRLSKTKSKTDEKENVIQENQPTESAKSEKKSASEKKQNEVKIGNKKAQKKEEKQSKKKKEKQQSKAGEKAVVNLRKNKKKRNTDPTVAKKSFDSMLNGAIAKGDNENAGMKAEEVGAVLTATQVDLIRQTIRKCWHFPAGLKNAEDLVVDIKMELNPEGNVVNADIINKERMQSDPDFRIAAENAYRAVLDPNCNPLPLPKERYEEWKDLELSFNPKDMFE